MWELTRSHQVLSLVLWREPGGGNLVLACLEPVWIAGPTRWQSADITVVCRSSAAGIARCRRTDPGVALDIRCGWVEVSENVKSFALFG